MQKAYDKLGGSTNRVKTRFAAALWEHVVSQSDAEKFNPDTLKLIVKQIMKTKGLNPDMDV